MARLEDRPDAQPWRRGLPRRSIEVAADGRPPVITAPRPGVPKPQGGKQMKAGWVGAAVGDGDSDGDVLGPRLPVLDLHVEVAIVIEDAAVGELELALV